VTEIPEVLPVHPFTGLRAVGIVAGRPVFPILGGDENAGADASTRLAEIDERLPAIRSELLTFAEGDLDDAATARFDALETEYTALEAEREPLARRSALIERVREQARAGRGLEHVGNGPQVLNRVQPFADLEAVQARSLSLGDVQSRALAAVEQADHIDDDQRARAESLLRANDRHGRIARHMLLTGSPTYLRAFEAILGGVQPWQLDGELQRAMTFADAHNRAMAEGTGGAGGVLVPFYLDPTIILTSAGSTNPFRQIARVETIATNKWHGVTSAGVTAGYLGEGVEVGDDSPAFGQPEVDVVKAAAYLQASFEVTQDTGIASDVGMLLADAKDTFEAQEMALGDGAAGHMTGVITGVAAVPGSVVTTATAGTYAVGDVFKLRNSLKPRYRKAAAWVAEQAIYDLTRQFATGSGQQSGAFWADLGMDTPSLLIGKPTYEASDMASTVATGNKIMLAGDFKRGFLIVDRIGMTVQYEPLVKGPNGRPTGEVGWFAHWRSGSNVIVPDALRLLEVQ
jgi:HK97 family phage major capsid protein